MAKKPKFIETDFLLLNRMLGGGIPVGKIIEIFGFEGCGKTTLAMELSKEFKHVYYMDFEHELDTRYAESIGAKFATFKQPITFEDGIDDFFKHLKKGKKCDLLIVDTIGSSITNEQLEKDLKDNTVGSLSGKVTIFLRKAEKILKPLDITLILLNHKKETIGGGFGSKFYTPGGRQIKYSASIRLSLTEKKNAIYPKPDGIIVNIWTTKNKVAQEMQDENCMYMIRRSLGLLRGEETFRLGLEANVIKKEGQSFKIASKSFRGKKAIIDFLCDPDNVKVREAINEKWRVKNSG